MPILIKLCTAGTPNTRPDPGESPLIAKRRSGLVEAAKVDSRHVLLSMPLKIRSLRAKVLQLLAVDEQEQTDEA